MLSADLQKNPHLFWFHGFVLYHPKATFDSSVAIFNLTIIPKSYKAVLIILYIIYSNCNIKQILNIV